jgi:hypothetical protein
VETTSKSLRPSASTKQEEPKIGQYYRIINLDKKEYIDPKGGAKLWEQAMNWPAKALFVLLANSNGRGGGDFQRDNILAEPVSGRWAGDRIVIAGDYAEADDPCEAEDQDLLYERCNEVDFVDISHLLPIKELEAW